MVKASEDMNAPNSYTDDQIEEMRSQLAKMWRQSKSQVTDAEARWYLDLERELIVNGHCATSRSET